MDNKKQYRIIVRKDGEDVPFTFDGDTITITEHVSEPVKEEEKELQDFHKKEYGIEYTEQPTKPPLGLLPRWLWVEKRLEDIKDAIQRYTDAGKEVPQEWINERYDLSKNNTTDEESYAGTFSNEPTNDNSFWTDDLVNEYKNGCWQHYQDPIGEFKKSKQSKQPTPTPSNDIQEPKEDTKR